MCHNLYIFTTHTHMDAAENINALPNIDHGWPHRTPALFSNSIIWMQNVSKRA